MSLLSELTTLLQGQHVPVETGVFSDEAPAEYAVLVPIIDTYDVFADNDPEIDVEEIRISLFTKSNYLTMKSSILTALRNAEITVTARQYIGYEPDSGYHHYNIDVAKYFETEERT